MEQTNEIKTSLKREYDLYACAMAFYKTALKELEQKHQINTRTFLFKFHLPLALSNIFLTVFAKFAFTRFAHSFWDSNIIGFN